MGTVELTWKQIESVGHTVGENVFRPTGFEMTRRFASGAASAAALARSRTMEALVLNRSIHRMSPPLS